MNIFKKLYCRSFQFIFKIALPFLPYKNPIILNNIEDIPSELQDAKVLIIVDPAVYNLGLLSNLERVLNNKSILYYVFKDVNPNPTSHDVNIALGIYKANSCNTLIAVGGGSSIDCAKAVGALIAKPKKTLKDLKGILKIRKKIPDLFAIPTTAGSGSETTLASVIVDSETRYKYAINDFPLIPKYAVLDPRMTETLPFKVSSTTGMDALTHAIEAFVGKGGNKSTFNDSKEAIKLIFNNIENACINNDYESRRNMLIASHMAGRAFSKAYVGYVHALSHAISGKYNTAHGLANSVILPIVLKEYGKSIYKKMKEIAVYCNMCDNSSSEEVAYNLVLEKIEALNKNLNIPKYLKINKNDIKEMALKASKEANPLYPVPVLWDSKKLEKMYMIIGGFYDKDN